MVLSSSPVVPFMPPLLAPKVIRPKFHMYDQQLFHLEPINNYLLLDLCERKLTSRSRGFFAEESSALQMVVRCARLNFFVVNVLRIVVE